jgi:hypothetical protein
MAGLLSATTAASFSLALLDAPPGVEGCVSDLAKEWPGPAQMTRAESNDRYAAITRPREERRGLDCEQHPGLARIEQLVVWSAPKIRGVLDVICLRPIHAARGITIVLV